MKRSGELEMFWRKNREVENVRVRREIEKMGDLIILLKQNDCLISSIQTSF